MLQQSAKYMEHLTSEIPRNVPHLDSLMFARHNSGAQQIPSDMIFEPSPVWHDENILAVDESAKNFLRNVLLKSKTQLVELKRDVDGKRREVESARKARTAVRDGNDTRDEGEIVRTIFSLQESLHESERQKYTAEVEIATIVSVVGDVSIGARNHNFKSETFTIPTHCDYCGDRIWGLSAKGFICRDCGFTCHSKCEMKIPAECPGELNKDEKKKLKLQRQESAHSAMVTANGASTPDGSTIMGSSLQRSDTISTLSSGYSNRQLPHRTASGSSATPQIEEETPKVGAGSRKHRLIAPPPMINRRVEEEDSRQRAKVMYAFEKSGPEEVSVDDGEEVTVLEPDGTSSTYLCNANARRWLGMDQSSSRIRVGHRSNGICRYAATSFSKRSGARSTTAFILFQFFSVNFRQQYHQSRCWIILWSEEKGSCCCSTARSKEAKVRRSPV
jgi:formin-binding protein 1